MDPIVLAAGTALVSAMATDAWQHSRAALVAVWRQVRPAEGDTISRELEELRTAVIAAQAQRDDETQTALAGAWRVRLQRLVDDSPAVAGELERVLHEALMPVLSAHERPGIGSVTMRARASDSARVYQAAGDLHITEP